MRYINAPRTIQNLQVEISQATLQLKTARDPNVRQNFTEPCSSMCWYDVGDTYFAHASVLDYLRRDGTRRRRLPHNSPCLKILSWHVSVASMAMTSTVPAASRDQAHRPQVTPLHPFISVRLSRATLRPRYGRSYIAPGTVNGAMKAVAVAIPSPTW
jgi:hypothetical protein